MVRFDAFHLTCQADTSQGKKYFQIVANASTFGSADLSKINRPQRLSVTFSDRTDIIGTETLDSWISTFSPGHHELPLSKPPSYEIARDSSEASGTPKKASSVEPAPPQLPAVDSGFGLSIVDDPAFGISPPDTVNASMALGSNPPSLSTSLDHLSINRSHSHDALPTGPDKANVVEQKSRPQTADQLFNVSVSAHPTKKPSVDRLAGQGMRRPLLDRVRYHCTPTKSSSRENRPSSQHSSLERPRSNIKYDSPNTDPTPETRSNAAQLAKLRREQKVRARKLREVQQAREKLENKNHADLEEVTTTKLTKTRARTNQTNYENAASRFSQLTISDECSTPQMPPPPPHTNEVIPIMVVAEQVPTPLKARPSKKQKPARLNLRDANQISRSSTIAVRSESPTLSPSIRTGITQISASPQIEPAQVSTSSSSQPSPDNTSPTVANLHTISMRRAKSAREPACQTHIPGSILNTAFPAPPSSFQRISIASRDRCTTSVSKGSRPESRLESRIEALERENRLFEAALMAVLRTSGTLNGCPCYVLSKTGGAAKERGRKDGDWERGRTRERVQRDPGVEALKAKRESGVSDCSEESGVSALEVYLGTRMGAKVGGMGN